MQETKVLSLAVERRKIEKAACHMDDTAQQKKKKSNFAMLSRFSRVRLCATP